jgi:enterochelin esterase family protein
LELENRLRKFTARSQVACNKLFFIGRRNVVPPAFERIDMKKVKMNIVKMTCAAVQLCLALGANSVFSQNAALTNAPGGPRGGSSTLSKADQAEIARLADLPAWVAGDGDGNYLIGPEYAPAPEQTPKEGVPKGRVERFTMNEADSKFYTGAGMRGATPTRKVIVYIPSQYVPGTAAPLIVTADAYGGGSLPIILDNMIADHRLPPIIAVMIANGGGDSRGSERGLEYDSVNGKNAEFIETEILPKVEKDYDVTLTKDPDARMTLGGSSGGASAFTMAWFHPELYHRVVTYSGTYVNKNNDNYPHGAWTYHESLIPNSPTKPLRVWLEVGEHDIGATSASSGLENWVIANIRMAADLKAKGYHYQFIYSKGAGHTDHRVITQTLPQALEYVWKGYPIAGEVNTNTNRL